MVFLVASTLDLLYILCCRIVALILHILFLSFFSPPLSPPYNPFSLALTFPWLYFFSLPIFLQPSLCIFYLLILCSILFWKYWNEHFGNVLSDSASRTFPIGSYTLLHPLQSSPEFIYFHVLC